MKFNNLGDLVCLLPEEEKEKALSERAYKEMLAQRPNYMQTKVRVLPLLPHWMRNKVIEAKELFDNNNTSYGDRLLWNHQLVLSLDDKHEVTFAILDDKYKTLDDFKEIIAKVVKVYEDLQVICRKYGYPLTLVSEQSDDFGMYLPSSFYGEESGENLKNTSYGGAGAMDFLHQLMVPRLTKMHAMEMHAKEFADSLEDEGERRRFNMWFAYRQKEGMDYVEGLKKVLGPLDNDYYGEPLWEGEDVYLGRGRQWGRELCVKYEWGESLKHVARLDKVYPLLAKLMEDTSMEDFAFGVKPKGKKVVERGNFVNAR